MRDLFPLLGIFLRLDPLRGKQRTRFWATISAVSHHGRNTVEFDPKPPEFHGMNLSRNLLFCNCLRIDIEVKLASCQDMVLQNPFPQKAKDGSYHLTNRWPSQAEWWLGMVDQSPSKSLFSTRSTPVDSCLLMFTPVERRVDPGTVFWG